MAEEKKESWLNWLALTTVILAVCATMSTFKGGGFSTRSVMSQSMASDQWAYYQSKSIKSYMFEMQRDKLSLELDALRKTMPPAAQEEYRQKIEFYSGKIKQYEDDKAKIETEAKGLEKRRDDSQRHSQAFGMAVIYLQISILLSSIAALMKKKPVYLAALFVGAIGVVFFLNGFFLFLAL